LAVVDGEVVVAACDGTIVGCRGRRFLQLQPGQGLVDFFQFMLDDGKEAGFRVLPVIEQRLLPLQKFGYIAHGTSEVQPPEMFSGPMRVSAGCSFAERLAAPGERAGRFVQESRTCLSLFASCSMLNGLGRKASPASRMPLWTTAFLV